MPMPSDGKVVVEPASGTNDIALLIGRVLLASLMLIAAFNKARAFPVAYFGKLGFPMPEIVLPAVIAFEAIVGVLLLVGFKTRITALVTGLFIIGAGLIAHRDFADGNHLNHFLKNVALLGGCLAFYVSGAGRHSVDRS